MNIGTATLADGGELRYLQHRYAAYSVWLYSARGVLLWESVRGGVTSIRPAVCRMRAILAGVDLDRDVAAIAADTKARDAYVALQREFGRVDSPVSL